MQRGARTGLSLATASIVALFAATVVAPLSAAAPAMTATTVTIPDLASGDAVLRASRSYSITSCSATSASLSLFVQTSSGRWVKVATSVNPVHSETCPFSGSAWLQTYNWTVNQVGSPSAGGPNRLNLAVGMETPRSKFVVGVWPAPPGSFD